MRDVQRTTQASNGNAKPSMTIFAALPIPPPPPSQRSKGEATNRDAKELVVRRRFSGPISVGSLGIKFLLDPLCNIFLYPRRKLGSLRGRLAEKTTWIREAWQRDPSIDKTICSSITQKNDETWMSKVGRTNAAWLQKVAVTSPYRAAQKNFVGVDHKPYMRCNTWALMSFQTVGLGSELNVSSLQRIVSSVLLRRKLRAMGDKISKNLCHSSTNATHHATEPPFSMNNITKLCGRSVPIIRCRSTSDNS